MRSHWNTKLALRLALALACLTLVALALRRPPSRATCWATRSRRP